MTISVQKIYHFLSLEISWFSLWTTLGSQIFETRKFLEFQENWFDSENFVKTKIPFWLIRENLCSRIFSVFSAWEDDIAEECNVFDIFDEELTTDALWCF